MTAPVPTLAERLRNVPLRQLYLRLGLARSDSLSSPTALGRMKARDEVRAILVELESRGERAA